MLTILLTIKSHMQMAASKMENIKIIYSHYKMDLKPDTLLKAKESLFRRQSNNAVMNTFF